MSSKRPPPPTSKANKALKKRKDKPTSTSGPYTALQLPLNDDKRATYTKAELESFYDLRVRRYEDLLQCARTNATHCSLLTPDPGVYAISMARTCYTLRVKLELIDIFHYLKKQLKKPMTKDPSKLRPAVSLRNFGHNIGINIPHTTLQSFLRNETKIRALADQLPVGAKYVVNRKNRMVEEVLYLWLQDQRSKQVPVNGKMIKETAKVVYTVLVDEYEATSIRVDAIPSFSASWFDAFKKRYRISYYQLHGEAAGVDLNAIEPELRDIRAVCANYSPDDIYNCDETGVYLKELVNWSYTVPEGTGGTKPNRSARVSILFCVNASGSSLKLAEDPKMSALRPLVIAKNLAREVEDEAKDRMEIQKNSSGWMSRDIFMRWLIDLDQQLERPSLLLLDSCPAHSNIDIPDPAYNYRDSWKFLTIQRLPKNSTSVTQPLDAGIISVFKRALLEILSQETSLVRTYDKSKAVSNGHAWSLIPYAWNRLKAKTVRNCFAKTPTIPDDMRQQLRQRLTAPHEQREKMQYLRCSDNKEEARAYFEHLIAEVNEGSDWKWTFRSNGTKDAQDLADESLPADPAVEEVDDAKALLSAPSPSSTAPYDTDERASSPLTDEVYTHGFRVLKERVPALGLMSIEGFKATRRLLSGGAAVEVKLSKGLKEALRYYGKSSHLGGPVEPSEVELIAQPLPSTSVYSDRLNLSHNDTRNTSHNTDNSSNKDNVVDLTRDGQVENESSEENEKEDDQEEQRLENTLIETQHYEDEEEGEDEPLLRRNRGEIVVPFAEEEEVTADYSNYSGHAADESNSDHGDSDEDSDN